MEPENPYSPSPPHDLPAGPPSAKLADPALGPKSPSLVFLGIVAVASLASDIATKTWAEKHLDGFPGIFNVWKDHIAFILAKNKGGAWGLLQSTNENVRRPFFLLVSVAAIAFIMALYRRLQPNQRALKWGLPLVLGGALGNVFDRIRYGHVIDFIDVHLVFRGKDHHWPTFNVADIAICVGVGLMAIDMFTSKRLRNFDAPSPVPAPAVALATPEPQPSGPVSAPPPSGDKP
jgi:signal peptidase II